MRSIALLLLAGCNPQHADVGGQWFAWLAASGSPSVLDDSLPDLKSTATVFECSGRGWSVEDERFDQGYIGPVEGDDLSNPRFVGGACPVDADGEFLSYCADAVDEMEADCAGDPAAGKLGIDNLEFHNFLQEDGFYAIKGELTPWRTEAIIGGEGDIQISIHQDLGAGADFRFMFTIKPAFRPTRCDSDDSGNSAIVDVDGSSWLERWAEDEDGRAIYYINAGARQVKWGNGGNNEQWFLVTDWTSGYGYARFNGEDFNSVPTDYGNYDADGNGPAFIDDWNQGDPSFLGVEDRTAPDEAVYAEAADLLRAKAQGWQAEMVEVAGAYTGDGSCDNGLCFEHKVEDNIWRPIDIEPSGLDGWMEVHSSWVRFDQSVEEMAKLGPGDAISGDFQVYYEGAVTPSRVIVKGTFKAEELKEDRWSYEFLEDDLRSRPGGEKYCK